MMLVETNKQIQKAKNDYMREYMKEWRRKNPKKAKDIQNRYWQKRADQKFTDQKCADEQ